MLMSAEGQGTSWRLCSPPLCTLNDDSDIETLVGLRCRVQWQSGETYEGVIRNVDAAKGLAFVCYDDGDERWEKCGAIELATATNDISADDLPRRDEHTVVPDSGPMCMQRQRKALSRTAAAKTTWPHCVQFGMRVKKMFADGRWYHGVVTGFHTGDPLGQRYPTWRKVSFDDDQLLQICMENCSPARGGVLQVCTWLWQARRTRRAPPQPAYRIGA